MSKNQDFEGTVLTEHLSVEWKHFLETAPTFNYLNMAEIDLVCPVPGTSSTLVVQDRIPYLAKKGPLEVIEKFFAFHRLMDYQLM